MLEQFGKAILNYFLMNFPPDISFKLSIDDYTFSTCVTNANLDETELLRNLQKAETNSCNNKYKALAIAAYQVKIAGDLLSVTASGSNGYYRKIRDNYPQYKNVEYETEIMNSYFKDYQIFLWQQVKSLFNESHRNIVIPEEHSGPGRYVQYPVKSHELTNTELLKWADTFRTRKLLPNQINITYKIFCDMFFSRWHSESYKRTVFNFYGIWDGRSYRDILNRKINTLVITNRNRMENIVLELENNELTFYNISTGCMINDFSLIQRLFYSANFRVFLTQEDSADFYSPDINEIEPEKEFVILTQDKNLVSEKDVLFRIATVIEKNIFFAIGLKASESICNKLRLEIINPPPIKFLGGIKLRNGHYFYYGLPSLYISDENVSYIYINSTKQDIQNHFISLMELREQKILAFEPGSYTIKITDCVPIKIEIDDFEQTNTFQPVIFGWSFTTSSYTPIITEVDSEKHSVIYGLYGVIHKTYESKKQNPYRNYIDRKKVYENRIPKQLFTKTIRERTK